MFILDILGKIFPKYEIKIILDCTYWPILIAARAIKEHFLTLNGVMLEVAVISKRSCWLQDSRPVRTSDNLSHEQAFCVRPSAAASATRLETMQVLYKRHRAKRVKLTILDNKSRLKVRVAMVTVLKPKKKKKKKQKKVNQSRLR